MPLSALSNHVKIVSSATCENVFLIPFWPGKTAVKSAAPSCWRFYGGYSPFSCLSCILLIFSLIHEFGISYCIFCTSKTMQNACKIVNLGLSESQSCSLILTILQRHFDYFAAQDTQNDSPKGWKCRPEPCFPPQKAWFSCLLWSARKCQPRCLNDTMPYI